MLIPCPECGNLCAQDAPTCPKCGKPNPAMAGEQPAEEESHAEASVWRREVKPWPAMLVIGVAVLVGAAWLLGTYHIVQSSEGTQLVRKVHFTLAESFVSLDAITGQPAIAAKAKYPLAIKALQRDGILESESAREERLQQEMREKMEQSRREVEAEMRKALGR